jgi:hypothetical protein
MILEDRTPLGPNLVVSTVVVDVVADVVDVVADVVVLDVVAVARAGVVTTATVIAPASTTIQRRRLLRWVAPVGMGRSFQ